MVGPLQPQVMESPSGSQSTLRGAAQPAGGTAGQPAGVQSQLTPVAAATRSHSSVEAANIASTLVFSIFIQNLPIRMSHFQEQQDAFAETT